MSLKNGAAALKIFSLQELVVIRFETDSGISLKMEGGWLELALIYLGLLFILLNGL